MCKHTKILKTTKILRFSKPTKLLGNLLLTKNFKKHLKIFLTWYLPSLHFHRSSNKKLHQYPLWTFAICKIVLRSLSFQIQRKSLSFQNLIKKLFEKIHTNRSNRFSLKCSLHQYYCIRGSLGQQLVNTCWPNVSKISFGS